MKANKVVDRLLEFGEEDFARELVHGAFGGRGLSAALRKAVAQIRELKGRLFNIGAFGLKNLNKSYEATPKDLQAIIGPIERILDFTDAEHLDARSLRQVMALDRVRNNLKGMIQRYETSGTPISYAQLESVERIAIP